MLPREQHHSRIQHQRQQEVRRDHRAQGPNCREQLDLKIVWDDLANGPDARKDDHHGHQCDADRKGIFEAPDHQLHLVEEFDVGGLLGGGAPAHVDGEHVRENGLGNVEGDTAEEDGEEGNPGEVFEDWWGLLEKN